MDTDHLCIGGGPAGMFAAITVADQGKKCTILESQPRLGQKLRITGKGRCNVTNNCDKETLFDNILGGKKFLLGAIARCTPHDVMDFFESRGVPLQVERGQRVFPASNNAADIVDALQRALREKGVPVIHARARELICQDGRCVGVLCEDGREYYAKTTLIATGGLSYPKTGSTGDGYHLARKVGHTVLPPAPSLVGLVTRETWCRRAMGLTLKNVGLRLYRGDKCIYEALGEMLFTHFGVSGPLILTASAYMRNGSPKEYRLEIDLKPGLTPEQLDRRVQRDLSDSPKRMMENLLHALLPGKLIAPVLSLCEISPETKAANFRKADRQKLCALIKSLPLTIRAFRPIEEAIVTRGGVDLREVDAKTMASKVCPGLYFAGEVLDADGLTGGFNLQIAFATGYSAGLGMAAC